MQTIVATGKYVVSFNTCFGDDEVGESRADSIDFAGDDINTLAEEVVASAVRTGAGRPPWRARLPARPR